MTDAIVSFAVEKLGELLIQEIHLHVNVKKEVEWLRNELEYMQSFIKDAEENHGNDHRVLQWIFEIKDIAQDAVDMLEDFNLETEGTSGSPKSGFFNSLQMCACIFKREANLHDIGKKIEGLKERVLDISRKRETYGIKNLNDAGEASLGSKPNNRSVIRTLRRSTSYADGEQLFVGFKDAAETLLAELLRVERRRRVIAIHGMGGLGKTTIARELYNSVRVTETFPYRAWVCVSQEYKTTELLCALIKSFTKEWSKELEMTERMDEQDLERYLRGILKDRKYIAVVDDVWQKEAWESLKRAFPENNNGSRVIITTRRKDVAARVDERSFVHELRFLTPDESWELFCKKISHGDGYSHWCSAAMLDLGNEMVEKCSGLPLAIVVLAGLLCHKKELQEWHEVKDHIWRYLKNDSLEISFLLSLSYNDLPCELKQCFLYLSIFPEDHLINTEKLMWLWMAEGYMGSREEMMEDVANGYLKELIDRSLIQVANKLWDKVVHCRIHDLLRDLAIQKAREVKFFDIYDPRVYSSHPRLRRHAVHIQIEKYFSLGLFNSHLRSLVFFNPDFENPKLKNLASMCCNCRNLCILDLENIRFRSPDSYREISIVIDNLIHLKFLGISNTNLGEIPSSLGKLKNLQTFCAIFPVQKVRLPPQVCELRNLRHLVAQYNGHLNIGSLTNLHTLKFVKFQDWVEVNAANFVNLQELLIQDIEVPRQKPQSLNSIGKLLNLTTLTLICSNMGYFPSFEPLSSCQHLVRLWLHGKIQNLEQLQKLPRPIMMLTLEDSELKEDPMPLLENLENLQSLELHKAYIGETIVCKAKGFPQLEVLRLRCLINLRHWNLANDAMPMIRCLGTFDCPRLTVPERIGHISALNETEHRPLPYYYPLLKLETV